MKTIMLINVVPPEECRVAILEGGVLEELYVERTTKESYVGNIYKGRIVNIEPGIQAAFVDFGVGRNGFLHISDVDPQYFPKQRTGSSNNGRRGRLKPPIQTVFRKGQEVVVQVTKESVGHKGPTLSTYISIPGRYLVLMPCLHRLGVSKKITDDALRRRLRDLLRQLNPPKNLGFIVRTAGADRSKKELERDLNYLKRVWTVVQRRIKKQRAPALIYQESDMVIRTIRDMFTADIDLVLIDDPDAYERAKEFISGVMPRYSNRFRLYSDPEPLFHKFGIEAEIEKIHQRQVPLPGGGSIVIEPTEALVAIDVNSGNVRVQDDAEQTALRVNLVAAREIARQLRLRDLGGMIVNDFIDMREEKHRRQVERALREAVRRDRAKIKVLRMSAFGTIEMTRQRIRPSLQRSLFDPCPLCHGLGHIKNEETLAIQAYRELLIRSRRPEVRRIRVVAAAKTANYLSNHFRRQLQQLHEETGVTIEVVAQTDVPMDHLEVQCFDRQDAEIPPDYWTPRTVSPETIEHYVKKLLAETDGKPRSRSQQKRTQSTRAEATTGSAATAVAAGDHAESSSAQPEKAKTSTRTRSRRSTASSSSRSRSGTRRDQKAAAAGDEASSQAADTSTAEASQPAEQQAEPAEPETSQRSTVSPTESQPPANTEPTPQSAGSPEPVERLVERLGPLRDEDIDRVRESLFEGIEEIFSDEAVRLDEQDDSGEQPS